MTVLQRAATIAVMTFSLTGLLGHSTPGFASELDRTAIPMPATNPLAPAIVPVDAASVSSAVEQQPTAQVAVQEEFDTLSDAVAAQDASDQSDAVRCLAGAIYFEAKGEPLAGQLAVANVIINRSTSGRFPAGVCAVVKQRGQFGFVRGGEIPSVDHDNRQYRTAIAVAQVAMRETWDSPAPKALYFNTPDRRPAARLTKIAMIGNHVFYR